MKDDTTPTAGNGEGGKSNSGGVTLTLPPIRVQSRAGRVGIRIGRTRIELTALDCLILAGELESAALAAESA